jgi:hypothetical protein
MMYFCLLLSSFVALYSGRSFCIYMDCTDIGYCIYGQCLWLCIYGYGYLFGC